ncbi:hypothetical protein AcV5_000080 [Taiwanofungus camphoratus]|nr:hypothetical protein AcV5_000080 [Antrodia cinnamomea]
MTMWVVSEGDSPLTRPASYPVKILWTLQDCKNDEDVAITKANPSRPLMQHTIHNKDGTMITEEDYRAILATARLCRAELLQLPPPPGHAYRDHSLARTKNYFKSYHPKEWAAALQKMEEQQPLLSLCVYHWKADHVLGGLFRSSSRRGMDSSEDDNDNSADNCSASTWLSTKQPCVPSSATNGAKKTKPRTSTSNPLSVHHTTVADEPIITNQALLMAAHDPPGSLTTPANVPLAITASDTLAISASDTLAISASDTLTMTASDTHMTISNNPLALATTTKPVLQPSDSFRRPLPSSSFALLSHVHSSAAIKSIDFAFIQVDLTLENLIMILAAEFPHFINGLELLNAMKLSPTFGIGAPLPQVLAFIERVECANPNTPDLSPDNTGTSWGHCQFTAGDMTLTSVLTSWNSIGTINAACRLIAAGPTLKGKEVLRLQITNFTSDTSLSTGLPTPSVFDIPSGSLAAHPSHDGTDVSPPPTTTLSSSNLATKAQKNESASSHSAVSRSDCVRNDLMILTKEALVMWINDHGLNSTPIAKQQIARMKKEAWSGVQRRVEEERR